MSSLQRTHPTQNETGACVGSSLSGSLFADLSFDSKFNARSPVVQAIVAMPGSYRRKSCHVRTAWRAVVNFPLSLVLLPRCRQDTLLVRRRRSLLSKTCYSLPNPPKDDQTHCRLHLSASICIYRCASRIPTQAAWIHHDDCSSSEIPD